MSDNLPEDVLIEILKRLPVKCLLKFRSVCKGWNRLITHPSFISTHLHASLSNPNSRFFLLSNYLDFFLYCDNDDSDEFKPLHIPSCLPYVNIFNSCNGLICLGHASPNDPDSFNLVLWNPSIQKHITLPEPNITYIRDDALIGLGFDSTSNDYKIVIARDGGCGACLFSLNENSWKTVTALYPSYDHTNSDVSAFANAAVHWLGYQVGDDGELKNTVFAFDISKEEFFEINLPKSLVGLHPIDLVIMTYEESSIAVRRHSEYGEDGELLDIWVMKEYGVVESWTKVFHVTVQSGRKPWVMGFRKSGKILFNVCRGEMASLDLNCQHVEYIETESLFSFECNFVESLVLLDKGVDIGCVNDM